jgi:hypothetical protein
MSDKLKQMAAIAALNKMMKQGHFSICTIDSVGKALGVSVQCESYSILSTLHCVDFLDMPPELRSAIPELINKCISGGLIYQFSSVQSKTIDVSPAEEAAPSFAHRLRRLL